MLACSDPKGDDGETGEAGGDQDDTATLSDSADETTGGDTGTGSGETEGDDGGSEGDDGSEGESDGEGSGGDGTGGGSESSGTTVVVGPTGLPTALPPSGTSGTLTTSSTAAPSGTISDVEFSLDLDHSCTKDLTGILQSPSGTTVVLFDLGSLPVCSSDLENTLLDDEASQLITAGSSPFTGPHRPTGFLSDFDGEDAAGVWSLSIIDDTVGDSGRLQSWSMELSLD